MGTQIAGLVFDSPEDARRAAALLDAHFREALGRFESDEPAILGSAADGEGKS